ncbi:MAG TPA: hypothetical protein ENH12_03410 [Proteobacteria bacterium]|nr:hypothetical protein [Pseudomonadota bacterium]
MIPVGPMVAVTNTIGDAPGIRIKSIKKNNKEGQEAISGSQSGLLMGYQSIVKVRPWALRDRAKELGLPLPKYAWKAPYLVLTIYRSREAPIRTLAPATIELLSETETKGWQWIMTKGRFNSNQYANAVHVEGRTARRHLNRFIKLGMLNKIGSGPSTEYQVI